MEFTQEIIEKIFIASGLTQTAFAREIGVDGKSIKTWIDGTYKPTRESSLAALRKALKKYPIDMDTVTTETQEETPVEEDNKSKEHKRNFLVSKSQVVLTAEEFKTLREKLCLSLKEMAGVLEIQIDQYRKYESGENYPRKIETRKRILRLWHRNMEGHDQAGTDSTPAPETETGRGINGKQSMSMTRMLDKATRFYNTEQMELRKQLVKRSLQFVAKEHGYEWRELQEAVATVLLLVKAQLTADELYSLLTGHTA